MNRFQEILLIINSYHAGLKEPCPYGKEGEPPDCYGELPYNFVSTELIAPDREKNPGDLRTRNAPLSLAFEMCKPRFPAVS